jgi:hypothetical protein
MGRVPGDGSGRIGTDGRRRRVIPIARSASRASRPGLSDRATIRRIEESRMPRRRKKTQKRPANCIDEKADGHQNSSVPSKALVTTSQAARIMGVSPSTIVRNRAVLGAILGPDRAYLFDEQVVREKITTIRRRQAVATLGPTSGEVASAVFAALKEGRLPTDIVIDLRVSPDVVLSLQEQFEQMRGRGPCTSRARCACGNGRLACYCDECKIVLELSMLEHRVDGGREDVRLVAQIIWGRLPEPRPGRWGQLVNVSLCSQWVAADSDEGRDLIEARHGSRPFAGSTAETSLGGLGTFTG